MISRSQFAQAACDAQSDGQCIALCVALPADGSVPEWVELIPTGQEVVGIDGRAWINDQPQRVIEYFKALQAHGRDLVIDWEHATERKAPNGDPAPAAGWGVEMQIREGGAIWARTDWTANASESIANREYRYLSPVLVYEKATSRIVGIDSVGLTNSPNLNLKALNREQDPGTTDHEETVMDPLEAIRQALNLKESATDTDIVTAINSMKGTLATAQNSADNPSLEKFVPRADYNQALERASNAETQLKSVKDEQLDKEIETAINDALKVGKITPATVDYHKAQCKQDGGLERFNEFVKTAPVVADNTDLDKKKPGSEGKALNTEEQRVAEMFGNSVEDIQQYGHA